MRRTVMAGCLDVRLISGAGGLLMLIAAALLAVAADASEVGEHERRVGQLEERIVGRFETLEHDFVSFVEMLENRFVGEVADLERQLETVLGRLEQSPWDEQLLAEVGVLQERIDELAAEVDRLTSNTRFLESSANGADSRPAT